MRAFSIVRNIFGLKCHELSCLLLLVPVLSAQNVTPVRKVRPNAPAPNEILVSAVTQDVKGSVRKLRGAARIETTEMLLMADEVDYDEQKSYAEARGHVKLDYFATGEHLEAEKVEYDLDNETGKYYNVSGSSPAKLETRPGMLTTTTPFSFQAKWAERHEDRYILHDGFITDCKLPKPWWTFNGTKFDIIPGKRAIVSNTVFRVRRFPIFYMPRFYKSLEREPRQSGFLTPNIGNSSRRGTLLGGGYYWAINRSYDFTYRGIWFTERGFAHNVDFRGKPTSRSDFNFTLYGVNDRGQLNDDGTRKPSAGGFQTSLTAKTELPNGWKARGQFNYLSSFTFRQEFTDSFFEATFSEVHSLGYVGKDWSSFGFNISASESEAFNWPTAQSFPSSPPDSKVTIRKLPTFDFTSRDREISRKVLPLWISWDSNYSLLHRSERAFDTGQFVSRGDLQPQITTAFRWKDIQLIPSFSVRETFYSASLDRSTGQPVSGGLLRSSRQFDAELVLPSLSRIFEHPPKYFGKSFKHVIEPRASFRYTGGIGQDFSKVIRFDETEILANTRQAEISVTNRLYGKLGDGRVVELLSWELAQQRYFDPAFGGALVPGQRNEFFGSATLTGYAFLDVPRNYSPVVSSLRGNMAGIGFEWRADYDPARGRLAASTFSVSGRLRREYFFSVGQSAIRSVPVYSNGTSLLGISPNANQLLTTFGYGQTNRRGFSAGSLFIYDYTRQSLLFQQTQVTYNTDCCGWSFQFRRINFANRDDYQYRLAFAVANIASFGTLRRQERLF